MIEASYLLDPQAAYEDWQRTEAASSRRRAVAERSIIQHQSMFDRFILHLGARGQTLATFGSAEIDEFFIQLAVDVRPDKTTHLRYLKLIDEVSRHLVTIQVRKDNPASVMLVGRTWPEDEPMPAYLAEADDLRLQRLCNVAPNGKFKDLRGIELVAIFLGTGITSTECRQLELDDLNVDGLRSDVYVKKVGGRASRHVPLDSFSIDCLGLYVVARRRLARPSKYLFIANPNGKPMDDSILYKFIKNAVRASGVTVADITPRILRNTYGRRHIASGCTNEQVSDKLGLSSQRTAARLRCTLDFLNSEKKRQS